MKVLIVDDHALFLEGMVNLLKLKGIEVVGTASDGVEALAKARRLHPEVILMDINMAGCNGIAATRLIKTELPDIKIVMLTMSQEQHDLYEAFRNGASGYLLKTLDANEFIIQLKKLSQGEIPLASQLTSHLLEGFLQNTNIAHNTPREINTGNPPLSKRQLEVLTLVSQGMTYREIGDIIGLTEAAIKYHMGEICAQFQVNNKTEAVYRARELGLIS